jgi:hypothetical protein
MKHLVEWDLVRKPKNSDKSCLSSTLFTKCPSYPDVGWKLDRCCWKPASSRPSCGTILFSLWKMVSSGMLRRVALVIIYVSEELSPSIVRVTRIGEVRTLTVSNNRRTLRRNFFAACVGCYLRLTLYSIWWVLTMVYNPQNHWIYALYDWG